MKRLLLLAVAIGPIGCTADRSSLAEQALGQVRPSTKVQALMGGVVPEGGVATTSTPADVTPNKSAYPSFQSTGGQFR